MGSSFSIPRAVAIAAVACLPPAEGKSKPSWAVTILYDSTDANVEQAAKVWENEFKGLTDGLVVLQSTGSERDVKKILDGHQSDGVFVYLGHGRNDGSTPFPVLGDGIKGRDIVNQLKHTRSTVIFNCCNMKKTAPGKPIDVDPGNAVVLFAQPNSRVELSPAGPTAFLSAFKSALRKQKDHQLAALRADDRVLQQWKERFNVYITEKDEDLEIAVLDDEQNFKVTVNKSRVVSNATSPVEEVIPFGALTDA